MNKCGIAPLTDISGADEIIEFYTVPEPRNQNRWIIIRKPKLGFDLSGSRVEVF